jgi:hypothetical protein
MPVRVRLPVYSPEWGDRIDAFIAARRWDVIADAPDVLRRPHAWRLKTGQWSRWAEGEGRPLPGV